MKKLILILLTGAFVLAAPSLPANALNPISRPVEPTDSTATRLVLTTRLETIKTMDKSDLSFQEKQELRNETKQIKTELNNNYGGVYISLGALIIIILLLIIIF